MISRKRFIILPLLALCALSAYGQTETTPTDSVRGAHVVDLHLRGLGFFYNLEIDDPGLKGYTLPGFLLDPTIEYHYKSLLDVHLGAYTVYMANAPRVWAFRPILAVCASPIPDLSITLGTLGFKTRRAFPYFLYRKEGSLVDPPEFGASIVYTFPRYFAVEASCDWEQFIWRDDPNKEMFTAGLFAGIRPLGSPALMVRLFTLFHHSGGEIDTNPAPVETSINAGGAVLGEGEMPWRGGAFTGQAWVAYSHDDLPEANPSNPKGWAFFSSVGVQGWGANLQIGYLLSRGFQSFHGDELYRVHTDWRENHWREAVDYLKVRLRYNWSIQEIAELEGGGELMYNTRHNAINYLYYLTLRFTPTFRLY